MRSNACWRLASETRCPCCGGCAPLWWPGPGPRRGPCRGDEDIDPAELEIDARLALLHGANDFGAEHALVIARGRLRIGAAQMDVVVGKFGHGRFSVPLQAGRPIMQKN